MRFKKIFGEEASKPQLIDFLNALLPQENQIVELSFKNSEFLGRTELDRKAVYDIYCENDKGEKFIVELQKAKQNYFRDRTIYYSTFPIQEQAEKGEWNYRLKAVYCIGILDFTFDDYEAEPEKSEVVHTVKLKNQHGKVFYDKLTYIYLEMPNFKKTNKSWKPGSINGCTSSKISKTFKPYPLSSKMKYLPRHSRKPPCRNSTATTGSSMSIA